MRALGPAICGTVVCNDLTESIDAYASLGMQVVKRGHINNALAEFWYAPATANAKFAVLASDSDAAWIRFIEDPIAAKGFVPFTTHGWLSLEVSVNDVDALGEKLKDSAFEIIGPPADLDVSDAIRAMQVKGPSGEILYLTQVKEQVPPFELPHATTQVDNLFIPVLITPSRDASVDVYEQFAGLDTHLFDTKITVINKAYGYEVTKKHPVAAIQLAGKSMIELDQLDAAIPRPRVEGHLPGGIAMVTFACQDDSPIALQDGQEFGRSIYKRNKAGYRTGIAGEGIEVLGR